MRGVPSSYAPRDAMAMKTDRAQRDRLSVDRQQRTDNAFGKLDDAALGWLTLYQIEKQRAARQGKPTLPTYEEYRNGVLPEETPTK